MKRRLKQGASLLLALAMAASLLTLPAAAEDFWRTDSREWGYNFAIQTGTPSGAGTDATVHVRVYRYNFADPNSYASQGGYYDTVCDNSGNDFENGDLGIYGRTLSIAPWMISKIELHLDKDRWDSWYYNNMSVRRTSSATIGSGRWPWTTTLKNIPYWGDKMAWAGRWMEPGNDHSPFDFSGNNVFKRQITETNFNSANLGLNSPIYIGADGSASKTAPQKTWQPTIKDTRYFANSTANPYYFPVDDPPLLSASFSAGNLPAIKVDLASKDSLLYSPQEENYQKGLVNGIGSKWSDQDYGYRTIQLQSTEDQNVAGSSKNIYTKLKTAGQPGTLKMSWNFPARSAHVTALTSFDVPVYRRAYQLGTPVVSASPALFSLGKDNSYVHLGTGNQVVTVTFRIPVLSVHDQADSNEKSGLAKALAGKVGAALYSGNSTADKIADGTATQSETDLVVTFTVPQNIDTGDSGLRLQLTGTTLNYSNRGDYICESPSTAASVSNDAVSFYFSSIKADTKAPTVILRSADGNDIAHSLNTPAKTHTFYPTADEKLYTTAASALREGLLTWQLSDGSAAATAPVSTQVLNEAGVNLALKGHEEGTYALVITAHDKGGNPLTQCAWPVRLDNKAPMVSVGPARISVEPDGSKRLSHTFDASDANGEWRVFYCFVPTGQPLPDPGDSATQVPNDPVTDPQWYFIDQSTSKEVMFKVEADTDYTGTLYYYAVDQFQNDSRVENREAERDEYNAVPVAVYNKLGEGTLNSNAGDYARDGYTITFTPGADSEAYYTWDTSAGADGFTKAGGSVPAPDGTPTGRHTLRYYFQNKISGARSEIRSQDFVFDNQDTTLTATLNAPLIGRSITASVQISDPSGIRSASYRIVAPDGQPIAGFEEQALTVKATREVDATIALAPPDNGVYNLQVTATDFNGHIKTISYDPGIPEQAALLFAIRSQAPTVGAPTTDIPDRREDGLPLAGGNTSYTITVPVEEAMKHMTAGGPMAGLGEQLRYQLSTDGINWPGDVWNVLMPMEAGTDKYALTASIQNPTPLKEGENRLFFRFSCGLENESTEGLDEDLISAPVEVRIFKDSDGPQVAGPVYDNSYPTQGDVLGTVTLRDSGTYSTGMTLSSIDENVVVVPVADSPGQFRITIKNNVDLHLIARDQLGNQTPVPVKVDWIDRAAPVPSAAAVETDAQGTRTDAVVSFTLTDRNGASAELALIDMSGVTGDTVPTPLRTEAATGADGTSTKAPDDFDRFSGLRAKGHISMATTAIPGGTSYRVTLRGLDGRYALGLYAKDTLGNQTLAGIQGTVFTVLDSAPAITSKTFAPIVTKSDTIATLTFNVPLAVLPQDEVQTALPSPGEGEEGSGHQYATVDAYNLALLYEKNIRAFSGSFTTTWRCGSPGEYKLYTLDQAGRVQVLTFSVTEHDVSFIDGFPISVRYLLDGADVTGAVAGQQWLGLGEDASLQIEITPAAEYDARQFFTVPAAAEQSGTALNEAASTRLKVSELPDELKPADPPAPNTPDSSTPADSLSAYYSKLVFDAQRNGSNTKQAAFSSYTLDGMPGDRLQTETVSLGRVDETAPVMGPISYSTTALTNGDVIATVTFADPESKDVTLTLAGECDAATLESTGGSATITFTQSGSMTIRATNAAGLSADHTVSVNHIDKRPITVGTDFRIDWFYEDYRGAWQPVTGPDMACRQVKAVFVPLPDGGKSLTATEGTDTLYLSDTDQPSGAFHYRDEAGNTVDHPVTWPNFDHNPPSIAVDFSETPTNQDIALTVTGSDGENNGAISHCEVKAADGTPLALTESEAGVYQASIPANGSYYIRVWDLAGNSKDQTITVNSIDKTAVAISSLIYTPDRGATDAPAYTAGSVEAYIHAFNKKGVTVTKVEPQLPLTESDIIVSANGRRVRFKDNGNVDITFVDSYGNERTDTLAVYNILKAAPTLDAQVTLDETNTSAVISFRQQTGPDGAPLDLVRGLEDLFLSAPGLLGQYTTQITAADTLTATENGTYTVSVFDEVGNHQTLSVVVEGIDKEPPVIENVAWSYGYSLNTDGTWTQQVAAGSHNVKLGEAGLLLTSADLAGAEGNVIRVNETNQDVTITLTADKPVSQVGANGAPSKEAVMVYTENGAFRFNLAGVNNVSASYGVNVQLIDKARPVITFGGAADLTFVEGDKSGGRYDKSLLLDYAAADVKDGVASDLTGKVTVDYGGFDPDHFENNLFDRNRPYTITYTVYDSAGNQTVATRTVRLVSRNDVVLLVDGRLPNSSGDISVSGSTIRAALKNCAGTAYVKYLPGRYTMGEMKYKGVLVPAKNGEYVISGLSAGWYTLAVQTDSKDFLTVYVYVNPTEEGADHT